MSRGWTWIDEDKERSEEEIESLTPFLDELAEKWSAMTDAAERRGWVRQAEIEDGDEPYFDSDEEMQEYNSGIRKSEELDRLRLEGIEAQLNHFGARMMRRYEHWNEDERYMEYTENRYD